MFLAFLRFVKTVPFQWPYSCFFILIFLQKIMPLVLKELASSDATNRRNAAFCVGEICKNGGAATLKYVLSYARIIIFHVLP